MPFKEQIEAVRANNTALMGGDWRKMSHTISYLVANKKEDILSGCREFAYCHVDRMENPSGSYHGNMKICEKIPICKDYDDAVETLEKMAEGTFYQDFAVRFYDTSMAKKTKKAENLEKKYHEMTEKEAAYADNHSVRKHSSSQIGCRNCGSKITISYLKQEKCPVCGKDLRADYILERLNKFKADKKILAQEIQKEKQKQADKLPVRWCYKVEVHS